jgi:hypothetical protein
VCFHVVRWWIRRNFSSVFCCSFMSACTRFFLTVGVEGNPCRSRNRMWPYCPVNRRQLFEWCIEEAVSWNYLASLWKRCLLCWIHWFSSFKLEAMNHKYGPYWPTRSVVCGENCGTANKYYKKLGYECKLCDFMAVRYMPEGRGFEIRLCECSLSICIILPAALGPEVCSATNINEYKRQTIYGE